MILVDCRGGRITPRNVYALLDWCTNTYVMERGRERAAKLYVPTRFLRVLMDTLAQYEQLGLVRYEREAPGAENGLLGYVNTGAMRLAVYRGPEHVVSVVHPVSNVNLLQAYNFST